MNKLKYYTLNLGISYLIALFLLFISSVIFTYTNINDNYLSTFVFVSVIISTMIGSLLMARKLKEKGILYGALFGLIYCAIIYLFTSIIYTGFFVSNTLWMYLGMSTLAGIVGGIIGVNI